MIFSRCYTKLFVGYFELKLHRRILGTPKTNIMSCKNGHNRCPLNPKALLFTIRSEYYIQRFKPQILKHKLMCLPKCFRRSLDFIVRFTCKQIKDGNMNKTIHLFFSKESQYLARSSGDLLEDCAILVTALLLMNLPQAWRAAEWKLHQRYK